MRYPVAVDSLCDQIDQSIRIRRLFPPRSSVLIGVSGGVDSMVLLHLLHTLAGKHRWSLTVAHLDHGLRGKRSRSDARFVERAAARLGLPCVVEHIDVSAIALAKRVSIEMAARDARHDFLARTARRLRIRRIALAHHADDQLELFFLRLFRGSGGHGLAGMKWSSVSPADRQLWLARPLLAQEKEVLKQYATAHRIRFREDSSNSDLRYRRNRVRHELLPLLRQHYQPALNRVIPRVMEILAAEADLSSQIAATWLSRNSSQPGPDGLSKGQEELDSVELGCSSLPFSALPVAVQRRCLQFQLVQMGITPDFDVTEELRLHPLHPVCPVASRTIGHCTHSNAVSERCPDPQSLSASPFASVPIFRDLEGIVHFRPPQGRIYRPEGLSCEIRGTAGQFNFGGVRICWEVDVKPLSLVVKKTDGCELFDADAVGTTLNLRHWQAGDRFWPIGMKNAVKLQNLFTNLKIPQSERLGLLLATVPNGDIFWVEGIRIAERFKVTAHTKRILRWAWKRL